MLTRITNHKMLIYRRVGSSVVEHSAFNRLVLGSNPSQLTLDNLDINCYIYIAGIAQLVEQRTENPRVTSSNLVPGII